MAYIIDGWIKHRRNGKVTSIITQLTEEGKSLIENYPTDLVPVKPSDVKMTKINRIIFVLMLIMFTKLWLINEL